MLSLYVQCEPDERDQLVLELWQRGTLGIAELGSGLRAWFEDNVELGDLIARYDGLLDHEPDQDWVRRTQDSFPPLAIGQRFWLVPPWNTGPPPPGRVRLEINPGLACGTGWHPCTQMCLQALERYLKPGATVLDVGAGSGILMVAARLLEAGPVIGCDIDPDAVLIARHGAGGEVFVGSADAIGPATVDVLVANISADAVRTLRREFERVVRPGGRLILSGFTDPEPFPYEIDRLTRDGWQCVVCRSV